MLYNSTWKRIQEYCYQYKFWININNGSKTFTIAMLETIAAKWYNKWSHE